MSVIQKILLVLSCIFYAATIYCLFMKDIYLVVFFFLLHSLCLIFFSYRTYADIASTVSFADTHQQDIGMEIAAKNKELEKMKEELDLRESRISELYTNIGELNDKIGCFEKEIEELKEEKAGLEEKAVKEKVEKHTDYGALLPPADSEGKSETVNIIDIAEEAKQEFLADAKNVNMAINISSANRTLLVKADPNRLLILFRNIIDNSIKYMRKAGSLVITVSTIGDDIFIVLKDTGEGLPEDETKHIFELNYQGSNRVSGNGLGLAQAKAIVEYYGGTIYAKSREGLGMGIYIQLPA